MPTFCQIILVGLKPIPVQGQNWHDAFVSLDSAIEIVTRSRKPKAVELNKWLVKKGVEKIQEDHQQAIEEKDSALALLNDDLDSSERQLVIFEQTIGELKEEIEELTRVVIPKLQDSKKNNGMVVIFKNNDDEYQYVAICGQQGYVSQKIRNKLVDYPNGHIVVLGETPNSIVFYNWLRERGCIEVNPVRVRHFKLGENYSHQNLQELTEV